MPTPYSEIHRLELAAGDHYALLHVVAEDTNKNGRLDWPLPVARARRGSCRGPLARVGARYPSGDRSVKALLPLAGGKAELVPDLVTPLGKAQVKRAPSGELLLRDGASSVMLSPAQCAGRVLHADAARQALLVACTGKSSVKAEVEIVAAGFRKPLKVAVQPTELDAQALDGERLVPVYPGADSLLVDLDGRDVHMLEAGDLVLASWGTKALLRNRRALSVYDAEQRSVTKLAVELARVPDLLLGGRFAFASPALVDVERGELVGNSPLRPLALSSSGMLLVAEGGAASAERLARGPLRWLDLTQAR